MQTFEKGGCESKENSDFEAKIRGLNSVSGEKLHDFEIICPVRAVQTHPHALVYGPGVEVFKYIYIYHLHLFTSFFLQVSVPSDVNYVISHLTRRMLYRSILRNIVGRNHINASTVITPSRRKVI